jgi:hypothetical protein
MVPVEFAQLGHAQSGQNAFRIPAEDRAVRYIGQACHSKRPCPHRVCEIVVRRPVRYFWAQEFAIAIPCAWNRSLIRRLNSR